MREELLTALCYVGGGFYGYGMLLMYKWIVPKQYVHVKYLPDQRIQYTPRCAKRS